MDRFELRGELGRGGMGVVHRAYDRTLGREVALKVLTEDPLVAEVRRQRFAREVQALTRLSHPHLVRILAAGENQGVPWFAMELIDGESLGERLRREGTLPIAEAVALVTKLARGVAYAHGQGVLHRAIKPANVLVDRTGAVRLTDFALARDDSAAQLTRSGQMLGTPGYWSPEQAHGRLRDVGPWSDVFGLGATLYATLTGVAPFEGESLDAFLRGLEQPATPPSRKASGVDAALDAICMRALTLDPAIRTPSAEAFADALEAYEPRAGSRRLAMTVVVALGLAALGVGGALLARLLVEPLKALGEGQ